jgi:hypothetical protein
LSNKPAGPTPVCTSEESHGRGWLVIQFEKGRITSLALEHASPVSNLFVKLLVEARRLSGYWCRLGGVGATQLWASRGVNQ